MHLNCSCTTEPKRNTKRLNEMTIFTFITHDYFNKNQIISFEKADERRKNYHQSIVDDLSLKHMRRC